MWRVGPGVCVVTCEVKRLKEDVLLSVLLLQRCIRMPDEKTIPPSTVRHCHAAASVLACSEAEQALHHRGAGRGSTPPSRTRS